MHAAAASKLRYAWEQAGANLTEYHGVPTPADFGDTHQEYDLLHRSVGLLDRSYRGVIEITGRDRADWLHNLTTNQIKELTEHQARYFFACNVKGRILFDGVAIILSDRIRLDMDVASIAPALDHFKKYIISEDVDVVDASESYTRIAIAGTGQHALLSGEGQGQCLAYQQQQLADFDIGALLPDLPGLPLADLFVPNDAAPGVWERLIAEGVRPVGLQALQRRRIEAGIPWSGEDIDEQVLPAETNQMERAVSFNKGCYLGQEVVERMRAHGSVARKFVGFGCTSAGNSIAGAEVQEDGKSVGRLTSVCDSSSHGGCIALGYIRTALARDGQSVTVIGKDGTADARVCDLPFVS